MMARCRAQHESVTSTSLTMTSLVSEEDVAETTWTWLTLTIKNKDEELPAVVTERRYWTLVLVIIPALTLFGNSLVVLSVWREASLRTATNYFIVSLAVADIMVAVLVMPLAVYVEVNNGTWTFGDVMCDAWIACDVMCCTASILNLTAICIDRFIAVTRPIHYAKHRSTYRVPLTVAVTWVVSVLISSPIVLGANYTERRSESSTLCTFYNADFIIYSSMGSFYVPCLAMLLLYWKIFRVINDRVRRSRLHNAPTSSSVGTDVANTRPTIWQRRRAFVKAAFDRITAQLRSSDADDSSDDVSRTMHPSDRRRHDQHHHHHQHQQQPQLETAVSVETVLVSKKLSVCRPFADRHAVLLRVASATLHAAASADDRDRQAVAGSSVEMIGLVDRRPLSANDDLVAIVENSQSDDWGASVATGCDIGCPSMTPSPQPACPSIGILTAPSEERGSVTDDEVFGAAVGTTLAVKQCLVDGRPSLSSSADGHTDWTRLSGSDDSPVPDPRVPAYPAGVAAAAVSTDVTDLTLRTRLEVPSLPALHQSHDRMPKQSSRRSARGGGGLYMRSVSALRGESKSPGGGSKRSNRREKKVTKTLAIVLGVFLACWFPFFTLNIINAVCIRYDMHGGPICDVHPVLFSFLVWLGYINSFLNPVIYTVFNAEFRRAFRRLLTPGAARGRHGPRAEIAAARRPRVARNSGICDV